MRMMKEKAKERKQMAFDIKETNMAKRKIDEWKNIVNEEIPEDPNAWIIYLNSNSLNIGYQ